ncbi:unnamed protein product [Didymodactylos carnosus]|uniref:Transmembrane protein n=1 Tax=Didymodactylos carnosus TaxID=1234261 RepID=A0A8S2K417_9BILA|nr:unnamed protein product [Didymodactylos carnosus]CAF3837845.1 unnamed protein product [Didymodactylos carnosus]
MSTYSHRLLILKALTLFVVFIHTTNSYTFSSYTSDYDAFGLKIAGNDQLIVEVLNSDANYNQQYFRISYAPHNNSSTNQQCFTTYKVAESLYIYMVAVGRHPTATSVFFAGEIDDGISNDNGSTFIGILNTTSVINCVGYTYSITYLTDAYYHQQYFVLGIEPRGQHAFGITEEFIFVYSVDSSSFVLWNSNETWTTSHFMPTAIVVQNASFIVAAGYTDNGLLDGTNTPVVYLFSWNQSNKPPLTIISNWTYVDQTQQYRSTHSYKMSLDINDATGQILVGIHAINKIFLLSVSVNNQLTQLSSRDNGLRYYGYGKGVAWLNDSIAAVLTNKYTLDSQTWISSNVYFYEINNGTINSEISLFPNIQASLPDSFSSVLLNIVSTPTGALIVLDQIGNILILLPTSPGYSPFLNQSSTSPVFSMPAVCMPGTYSSHSGVDPCILCPQGTKNTGNDTTLCSVCSSSTLFCPLGAVAEVNETALAHVSQAQTYPDSPESTQFDDILLQNMFTIGQTGPHWGTHCLIISPLFWALIVSVMALVIITFMCVLKFFLPKDPRSKKWQRGIRRVFRQTDLVGEGEFWVGGLASFSIMVLVCFAYAFSNLYLHRYPIERLTTNSNFACDPTIRNAKFTTSLQSLAVPVTTDEQNMFNILNNQQFTVHIDFVNTQIPCTNVAVELLKGFGQSEIDLAACSNEGSILSIAFVLPYQGITVQIILNSISPIGGLRVGMSGDELEIGSYSMQQLQFYEPFSVPASTLAQTLAISLQLTKVINRTEPLSDSGEEEYSALWIPTFQVNLNEMFLTYNDYFRYSNLTQTTLTLTVSETAFFIKNVQQPIAKEADIIFYCLLFTIVCLEIFGIIFLCFKLLVIPMINFVAKRTCPTALEVSNDDKEKEETSPNRKKKKLDDKFHELYNNTNTTEDYF